MTRFMCLAAIFVTLTLSGCGGVSEVTPDESLTPKVDQAEIDRQIQEGMQKGGMKQYGEFKGGSAPTGQ